MIKMFSDEYYQQTNAAVEIIKKAVRSGKLLVEYKGWENLDEQIKLSAIRNQTCSQCNSTAAYALTHDHNIYSTELYCHKCRPAEECNYCKELKKAGFIK